MYPVSYQADFKAEPNRVTTFFRIILAIPWLIVAYVYLIIALFTHLFAWVAVVILGRYPEWLYNFNSGVVRYLVRAYAWAYLQTDAWPPFGISDDPSYPIRVNVAPRAERQSRLKAFFRIILIIPMLIVSYAVNYIHLAGRHHRLADDRLPRLPAGGDQLGDDVLQQLLRPRLRLFRAADRRLSADRDRAGEGRAGSGGGSDADAAAGTDRLNRRRQGEERWLSPIRQ